MKIIRLAPLLFGIASISELSGSTITSATPSSLPVGETITLTGTGFTGTSKATFFYQGEGNSASFNEISDTTLEVNYSPSSTNTNNLLFVEAHNGSSLSSHFANSEIVEFTEIGSYQLFSPIPQPKLLIVKNGAVLQGLFTPFGTIRVIYVEAGGTISNWSGIANVIVFAGDGALLDLRTSPPNPLPYSSIFYSPNTQILGTFPTFPVPGAYEPFSRETTSISLSPGIGPFTIAYVVDISIAGEGSVSRDLAGPYYPSGTVVELTAEPGEGGFFNNWSGGANSTNSTIAVTIPTGALTATFSTGRTLTTYSGEGGTIVRDPNLDVYPNDSTVTLTPQALPAFEFMGWGGDISSDEIPLTLTLDSDLEVIGIFRANNQDSLPQILSSNHSFLPVGETLTLTGTSLENTIAASFLNKNAVDTSAATTSLSDTALEVTFTATRDSGNRLLVETTDGSTLTVEPDESSLARFQGVGDYPGNDRILVVEPGAILEGIPSFHPILRQLEVIYVRAGGIFRDWGQLYRIRVFAEDGAILDFTDGASAVNDRTAVFHSPTTQIIGEMPTNTAPFGQTAIPFARELTSLSLSPGVNTFGLGYELDIQLNGEGSIYRDLSGPYYQSGDIVELTAQAAAGGVFSGWTGGITSAEPIVSVQIPKGTITANFDAERVLTTYSGLGGTIVRNPDLATYPTGSTVTLTPQPATGYEFIGWGGEVTSTNNTLDVTLENNLTVVGSFRSLSQDNLTKIANSSPEVVPVGQTLSLSGSGFSGTTQATFLGRSTSAPTTHNVLSDTELEVEFQSAENSLEMLLIETPNGSTLAAGPSEDFGSFQGVGALTTSERVVLVEAGSILESSPLMNPFTSTRVYYVKAGAVFRAWSSLGSARVFAENGAVLDFTTGGGGGFRTQVYYGPGTELIGSPPASPPFGEPFAQQLTSISLSPNVGLFEPAYTVSLTSEGPGTVTGLPVQDYYRRGDTFTLNAVPDTDNFFIRWSGSSSSTNTQLNISVSRNLQLTARFSPLADFVTSWRLENFSAEQLADPNISGLSADPDEDGLTNTAEYVFGSNPLVADSGADIQIMEINPQLKEIQLSYLRPKFIADVDYLYFGSSDLGVWRNLSESELVEEVATEEASENLERITLKVSFEEEEFPLNYSFRIGAELL